MIGLWIIVGIIVILIGIGAYVGNYFFTIAIRRDSTWFDTGGHELLNSDIAEDREPTKEDKEYEQQLATGAIFYDSAQYEDVTIQSKEGLKLYGRWIESSPDNNTWAILVHGYRSSGKRDWSFSAKKYAEQGINTLIPDMRAHGESEGKYIGMGNPEHLDVLHWIDYLLEKKPNATIILHGCSMGAATVMVTLGQKLPSAIKLAIADCGYTSAKAEFGYVLNNMMKLPQQPILFLANVVTKIRTGYSLYGADSIKGLNNNTLPVLFIHGDSDNFVPTKMVYENQKATRGESELLIFERAPHFSSMIYDPKRYYQAVFDFINKYL